jgi:hypothetical protein
MGQKILYGALILMALSFFIGPVVPVLLIALVLSPIIFIIWAIGSAFK